MKMSFPFSLRAVAIGALSLSVVVSSTMATAQVNQFGGNAQHTSNFGTSQNANVIKQTIQIKENMSTGFGHFAHPLITSANTLLMPIRTSTNGYRVDSYDAGSGAFRFSLASDWINPQTSWFIPFQPVVVPGTPSRMYMPGAGGTVLMIEDPDAASAPTITRLCFYTDLTTYNTNAAAYNASVYLNSAITADSAGNIYFTYRTVGTSPAPLSSTQGGIVRIDPAGNATYVVAGTAAADAGIEETPNGSALVISNDGTTVYGYVRAPGTDAYCYLVGLNSTTLATKYKVFLWDPRNNGLGARIIDQSTGSPMVAPDNDLFVPVFANPYNGSRGFLLHFNEDLTTEYTPGGFGWDYSPSLVPASMVPSYTGSSSYLIFAKYNNYATTDGNGINSVAILDPNSTQIDFHSTSPANFEIMREVLKANAPTPDADYPTYPGAARELCINISAVDAASKSVIFDCADGHLYKWDLEKNQFDQAIELNSGILQPYVPTVVGTDGTIYTLNGGYMFAIGETAGVGITLTSDNPDMRSVVYGTPLTFTANVTGNLGTPTGTVTFVAQTHNGFTEENTNLGTVALDAGGMASVTISTLAAGGAYLGNHRITASYSGDGVYSPTQTALQQKVHPYSTVTNVTTSSPANYGDTTVINVHVASGGGVPSGYVTFMDGTTVIGQLPLNISGDAALSVNNLSVGDHTINCFYNSDTWYASSSGSAPMSIVATTSTALVSSGSPTSFGSTVTFTATVSSGAGTPSGTVTFKDGATTIGSSAVDGAGEATLNISTLAVGSHTITAEFAGSGGWGSSASSSVGHDVTQTTSTTLVSAPVSSIFGNAVTFTATVVSNNVSAGTPTGSVEFYEGATLLGTSPVNGAGQATYNTSALSIGSHTITANFIGTNGWQDSTDDVVHVVSATDTTPPSTPTNFTAVAGPTSGRVTLSWTASTDDSGISHYEIWRSSKPNSGFLLLTTTANTSYIDNIGRRKTRYYYIVAVDVAGNRSAPTAILAGTSSRNRSGS